MRIAGYFQLGRRANDTEYWYTMDLTPPWLYEAVMDAHDGEPPNDWRFETCFHIAQAIDEGDEDAWEIADGLVDTYNSALLDWLSGHMQRASYVDQWHEEFDENFQGLFQSLRAGQLLCIENMAQTLIYALNDNKEDTDAE